MVNKVKIISLSSFIFSNIIKGTDLSIPANEIEISLKFFNETIDGDYRTKSTDKINFKGGQINIDDILSANKHKNWDKKNININPSNCYIGLNNEYETEYRKKYEVYIVPNTKILENNITINVNGKNFKNIEIINFLNKYLIHNSRIAYSSRNDLEIDFINIFRTPNYICGDTNLQTEIDSNEYCIKNYTCGSNNISFNEKEPTCAERNTIIKDIINNKKVTLTLKKCNKRINFYHKENKEFDLIDKKYQQILDIIEKYRSGRYDNENITFKDIVDEIKALSIYPGGEISILECGNKNKEYNSDNNPINFNSEWFITLPDICYNCIKLNVKLISEDNNFELKKLQGFTDGNIEIDAIQGYTLLKLKNILCSTLNLPDEFKENDGLTYNYEGNNTALKDTEVFSENKTIEIHIPNTKTNLVTKKQSQKKDDNENNNNNVGEVKGDGNGNKEVKGGGKCCNKKKK